MKPKSKNRKFRTIDRIAIAIALILLGVSLFTAAQWYYGNFGWDIIPWMLDIAGAIAIVIGLVIFAIPVFRKEFWL